MFYSSNGLGKKGKFLSMRDNGGLCVQNLYCLFKLLQCHMPRKKARYLADVGCGLYSILHVDGARDESDEQETIVNIYSNNFATPNAALAARAPIKVTRIAPSKGFTPVNLLLK